MTNTRIIVDGLSLLFTNFHAMKELKCKKGYGTGAAFGTIKQLLFLFTKYRWSSNDVILAWDRKAARKLAIFPEYKAKRKQEELPPLMSVPAQIKITERMITYLGINQACCEGEEADDVCATLANLFEKKGRKVFVISKDHDMQQCLTQNTSLLIHHQEGMELYIEQAFIDKHGVPPSRYANVQTLGGCQTDAVPGMKGISEETAFKICALNSWEKITSNDEHMLFPDVRGCATKFKKNFKDWDWKLMSQLVTLRKDVRPEIQICKFEKEKLRKLFLILEFKQYLQPDNFDRVCEIFGGE